MHPLTPYPLPRGAWWGPAPFRQVTGASACRRVMAVLNAAGYRERVPEVELRRLMSATSGAAALRAFLTRAAAAAAAGVGGRGGGSKAGSASGRGGSGGAGGQGKGSGGGRQQPGGAPGHGWAPGAAGVDVPGGPPHVGDDQV